MGRPSSFIVIVVIVALGGVVDVRAQAVELTAAAPAIQQRLIPIPRPAPPVPPRPPGDGWVWVPPTYRTVYERVWQEPVYREVSERVWVPEEYGWRTVECWEDGAYVSRQVWTVVRPGYWTMVTRREVVSPGGWVYRARREMVTPGHWEWRGGLEPAPVPVPPRTAAPRPPGLEPFSPLWEWPEDKAKG